MKWVATERITHILICVAALDVAYDWLFSPRKERAHNHLRHVKEKDNMKKNITLLNGALLLGSLLICGISVANETNTTPANLSPEICKQYKIKCPNICNQFWDTCTDPRSGYCHEGREACLACCSSLSKDCTNQQCKIP